MSKNEHVLSKQELQQNLEPLLSFCRDLDLSDPGKAEQQLEAEFPFTDEYVQSLRALCAAGLDAGWLCDRGEGAMRYSRVVKPDGEGASVDAVLMSGVGPRHRHPNGEIDLCFAWDGAPTFDRHPPGWVVFASDSRHAPTVDGGTMCILYILPVGAIEWLNS